MAHQDQPAAGKSVEGSKNPSPSQIASVDLFCLASWRGEIRILGLTAFAVPPLTAIGLIAFAAVLRARAVNADFVNNMLIATLEALLPLAAGIVLTTIAAKDDAIEVQLSLATPYRNTAARRVALVLGWSITTAFITAAIVASAFPSALPRSGFDLVLLWLAPTLWLSAVGMMLALFLRSRASAVALLGVVWLVQLAFHGYFASYDWTRPWFLFATLYTPAGAYWHMNRLELIATAIVGLVVCWMYLRNTEWRFRGEDISA
jgi:hypothetical protein